MKINISFHFAICNILVFVLLVGCRIDNSSEPEELSIESMEQIESEIRQTVDDYFENVKSKNLDAMLSFWSDSEDFIHAGDGSVFGGYEKWSNWLTDRNKKGTVEEWLYWNNSDIHVIVLSKDAAAYTMNFENAFIENGETRKVTGSWTYVFRKSELGWQVVMSNGHHIGLSYDE
jgi:ketosteroid isomerase-like protein